MRIVVACLLVPVLLGAASAAAPPPPWDHVSVLVDTWSCRTMRGAETHKTASRTGDRIDVVNQVVPAGAPPYVLYDRYAYDPVIAQWHVVLGTGSSIAIEAIAPTWTSATWVIVGRQIGGGPARVTYELLSDRDMRRKIEFLAGDSWRLSSAERCFRGEELPPPGIVIVAG